MTIEDLITHFVNTNSYASSGNYSPSILISVWEAWKKEYEHQEKRMNNVTGGSHAARVEEIRKDILGGTEMACLNPAEPFPTDSNETKLAIMGEKHTYVICRIQSMHKLLLDLNAEVIKTSSLAGIHVRKMLRELETASMEFMTDARKDVKKFSDKIQVEVDANPTLFPTTPLTADELVRDRMGRPGEVEGTSPGLEPVKVCHACGVEWFPGHQCDPTTIAR